VRSSSTASTLKNRFEHAVDLDTGIIVFDEAQRAKGVQDKRDFAFADWSRPEKPMGRFSDRELVRTSASTASAGRPH
jgi:hypothetical protein